MVRASNAIKKPPVDCLARNRKLKRQALKDYYEKKIENLINMNLPPRLIMLACWDAPVERHNLSTKRGREKFIKKCLKYYRGRLKELEREEKGFKLFSFR